MEKVKLRHGDWTKRNRIGFTHVCIWIFGFLAFQLYSFISLPLYLFINYDMSYAPKFAGLDDYVRLFTKGREFWNPIVVILKYIFTTVPGKVMLTLITVVVLNRNPKGTNSIRTAYYTSSLLGSSVVVAILWKVLFMNDGFINSLLGLVHIGPVKWLGTPGMVVITICMLETWQFGSSMVLFLSALRQVSQSLYETARVGGVPESRMFLKTTLPIITSIMLFNIIMQLITVLQNFTSVLVVTSGGPNKAIYVLGIKLYTDASKHFKMEYACTTSWILFMVILVMTIILFVALRRWVYYDNQENGTKGKKTKSGIIYAILGIVGVVMLLPVIWMFPVCSKTSNGVFGSLSLLPRGWSPETFIKRRKTTGTYTYAQHFISTFALVVPIMLLTLVSCSVVAYGFARFDFPGSQFLSMVLIATLMLPSAVIIILRCVLFNELGWPGFYMTFYALAAVGCYPFSVFMMVQFLRGLPRDLDESACIGGCGPFQCSIQILLPSLKPVLLSAGPFQLLWTWNDFFSTNTYINVAPKFPLSLTLRVNIDVTSNIWWNQAMSMALVSVTPLILPPFTAQEHSVEGIVTSGLKGRLGEDAITCTEGR